MRIIISYVKLYKCVQTNDYHQVEIVIRNHMGRELPYPTIYGLIVRLLSF